MEPNHNNFENNRHDAEHSAISNKHTPEHKESFGQLFLRKVLRRKKHHLPHHQKHHHTQPEVGDSQFVSTITMPEAPTPIVSEVFSNKPIPKPTDKEEIDRLREAMFKRNIELRKALVARKLLNSVTVKDDKPLNTIIVPEAEKGEAEEESFPITKPPELTPAELKSLEISQTGVQDTDPQPLENPLSGNSTSASLGGATGSQFDNAGFLPSQHVAESTLNDKETIPDQLQVVPEVISPNLEKMNNPRVFSSAQEVAPSITEKISPLKKVKLLGSRLLKGLGFGPRKPSLVEVLPISEGISDMPDESAFSGIFDDIDDIPDKKPFYIKDKLRDGYDKFQTTIPGLLPELPKNDIGRLTEKQLDEQIVRYKETIAKEVAESDRMRLLGEDDLEDNDENKDWPPTILDWTIPDDEPLFPDDEEDKHPANPEASMARRNIRSRIMEGLEKYDKLPLKKKLLISGGLLAAGMVAGATGSGAIAATVWTGQLALRGAGSILAGRAVEKLLRQREIKLQDGEEDLSPEKESELKRINILSSILVFVAGSAAGHVLSSFMNSGAESHVTSAVQHVPTPESVPVHVPIPEVAVPEVPVHVPVPEVAVPEIPAHVASDVVSAVPTVPDPSTLPSPASAIETAARHSNFVGIHEVIVRPGDTLTKLLLHDGIWEMFKPEDIAKLSWQAKQNLLGNVIEHLSADQLKEIGISSGKAGVLKFGETVDVLKLADIAKHITVQGVPLLERALQIN